MKKLITTTALALLLAACTQTNVNTSGMMSADMMKRCHEMMGKDGMMQDMSDDMMQQCQSMMQQSVTNPPATSSDVNGANHQKHHPAQ